MAVMSSKLGVNAFGATQTKPTSTNATQAQVNEADLKKFGADSVGELLNKVSDPNWVDPSKKTRAVGNDKLDKDAFFKLMLAQMKNQDPTNPLKSHEMAAQLASFSSLEQMQNMNTTLTELKNGQKPSEQFQVLQLLGKAVAGDSSKVTRAKGDKSHEFVFNLPMKAKEVDIRVRNAEGEVVKSYKLSDLKPGENRLPWNGQDEKGNPTTAGEYQFFIEAKNDQGQKMAIKTEFEGTISGVNYAPDGPVLMIGNQTIRLKDVKKIVDPSLLASDQKNGNQISPEQMAAAAQAMMPGLTSQPTASTAKPVGPQAMMPGLTSQPTPSKTAPTTKGLTASTPAASAASAASSPDVQGAPAAPTKSKLMENVGMSNGMMEKLAKETTTN